MSSLLKLREWVSFPEAMRLVETLAGKKESAEDLLNALIVCGAEMRSNITESAYIFENLDPERKAGVRPLTRSVSYEHWYNDADEVPCHDGLFHRANIGIGNPVKPTIPINLDRAIWFKVQKGLILDFDLDAKEEIELLYQHDGSDERGNPIFSAVCWRLAIHSDVLLFRPREIEAMLNGELDTSHLPPPPPPRNAPLVPQQKTPMPAPQEQVQYKPDKLVTLNQAFSKFWSNADPSDRSTHPNHDDIEYWLIERGYSQTLAQKGASIIRPEWAATGRKPEK